MTASDEYFRHCRGLIERIEELRAEIEQAADWFSASILPGSSHGSGPDFHG